MKNCFNKNFLIIIVSHMLHCQDAMQAKDTHINVECFKHNIQLQLSDSLWISGRWNRILDYAGYYKRGNQVTIQFPVINFQTGPVSPEDRMIQKQFHFREVISILLMVSYRESIRPNDLVYRSIVAASNNGASLPFSFAQPIEHCQFLRSDTYFQ